MGRYEEICAAHEWKVPERYNIAADVCDKHPRDKLAMIWERHDGARRDVTWGELQDLSNQAANLLAERGIGRGDRVAVVLPPTPETAAIFFGTWKLGAILLSMSVLYGDEGIRHRLDDSQAGTYESPLMPGDEDEAAAPAPAKKSAAAKSTGKTAAKKERSSPMGLIIAVVAVIVLAGGGWFAYQKVFSKPAIDPAATQAAFTQAQSLARKGQIEQAIAVLQEIKPEDPQHDRAVIMIADLERKKSQAAALIDGKPAEIYYQEQSTAGRTA